MSEYTKELDGVEVAESNLTAVEASRADAQVFRDTRAEALAAASEDEEAKRTELENHQRMGSAFIAAGAAAKSESERENAIAQAVACDAGSRSKRIALAVAQEVTRAARLQYEAACSKFDQQSAKVKRAQRSLNDARCIALATKILGLRHELDAKVQELRDMCFGDELDTPMNEIGCDQLPSIVAEALNHWTRQNQLNTPLNLLRAGGGGHRVVV